MDLTGFQAGRFQLYMADAKKPVKKLDEKALPPAPLAANAVAGFVPAVEVTIDPEKNSRPKKFKLFLENASGIAGVKLTQIRGRSPSLQFTFDIQCNQGGASAN